MINITLFAIIGLLVGLAIGLAFARLLYISMKNEDEMEHRDLITDNSKLHKTRAEKKEERISEALAIFDTKKQIKNDDIETGLQVSDATATRYLEELEGRGLIRQIGEKGRQVYYVKNRA